MTDNNSLYFALEHIYFDQILIGNKCYRIVYLNNAIHRRVLSKYLLQIRYFDKDLGSPVQVCEAINSRITKRTPQHTHMAVVWNATEYNTQFVVEFSDSLTVDEVNMLLSVFKIDSFSRSKQQDVRSVALNTI